MTRILLVEDQATAAAYLAQGLREAGLAVDVALTGPEGLHQLLTVAYDLAVLDVMLPGIDGWDILGSARRAHVRTPVLFLLRRWQSQGAPAESTIFTMADLTLDLIKHKVSRGGERIDLTPKEFALLALLMRRAGEVQSRTVIADKVWDMHFESETNVVEVAIRRLRTKIDDPFERKLLHTVRGVGYVLEIRD
jgi:two-component system copper resistance phosphate regulon response regulator CusR